MFPFFEPISWVVIYSFWLTLTMSFFLFMWMLKKLCISFWSDFTFFSKNMVWYFLSVFLFSSLLYVMWSWYDMKYMNSPFDFFMMSNYNFSLAWAMLWFFIVFFMNMKLEKKSMDKLIDPLVLSFLFMAFIWYMWAHLWGQVYWSETTLGMEMLYTNTFSPIPFQVPIFPLSMVYSMLFFMLFSAMYMLSMYMKMSWLMWYMWMMLFSSMMLIFEFFSWKIDMFKNLLWMNLMQLFSLMMMSYCAYLMYNLVTDPKNNKAIFK